MSYARMSGLGAALTSANTKVMQTTANGILVPQGYKPITVDGIVGPLTCGAVYETAKFDGGAFLSQSQAQGLKCTTITAPTRVSGATVPQPVGPAITANQVIDLDAPTPGTPAPSATSSLLSSITPTKMLIAGGVVAGVIVLVYANKKKTKAAAKSAA